MIGVIVAAALAAGGDVARPIMEGYAIRKPAVASAAGLREWVAGFNRNDTETVVQAIPNASAAAWMEANVPLFECPERGIEETYYFRWWMYRKQVRLTPSGFVVTEFLPDVPWAGKWNTIPCAAGHHIAEGRWLADPRITADYARFWFGGEGEPRRYTFWAADAIRGRELATGDRAAGAELLPKLVENYEGWVRERRDAGGLFWQEEGQDGMEVSIGGTGYRATINAAMWSEARAIAALARDAGRVELAARFEAEAAGIRRLTLARLWDPAAGFFKVLPRGPGAALADVRELHGYSPWFAGMFGVSPETRTPDAGRYAAAWRQLVDPQGFRAAFGPTTAERRHPRFRFAHPHECLWNGPSWPYATSITLTALANLLNAEAKPPIGRGEFAALLRTYALSHRLRRPDGTVVPWIDENLDPDTGEWIARRILLGRGVKDRGKDYNHSTFCDLVITGLAGLRPRADQRVEVNPLAPPAWDWWLADRVPYHGRSLTILWDRTGARYRRGRGLRVLCDGVEIGHSSTLGRMTAALPGAKR